MDLTILMIHFFQSFPSVPHDIHLGYVTTRSIFPVGTLWWSHVNAICVLMLMAIPKTLLHYYFNSLHLMVND